MKFSPERVRRLDIKTKHPLMFYSQWVKVFEYLRKDIEHKTALKLLSQYNEHWVNSTEFIMTPKNDHGVPEQGMLSALGYSVAQNIPGHKPINSDDDRRLALLIHISKNECPPISDETYRSRWGAPSSIERLDQIISVLGKLANTSRPDARYGNMKKSIERWNKDAHRLKQFKTKTVLPSA